MNISIMVAVLQLPTLMAMIVSICILPPTENKLYLNKGGLSFQDVTQASGAAGRQGPWKTGVSIGLFAIDYVKTF